MSYQQVPTDDRENMSPRSKHSERVPDGTTVSDEEDHGGDYDAEVMKTLKDRRRSIGVASPPKLTIHTTGNGSSTSFEPLRTGGKLTPRSALATPRSGKFAGGGGGVLRDGDARSVKSCTKFIKLKGVPKPTPTEDPNSEPFPNETRLAIGTDGQPVKPTLAEAQAEVAEDPSQKIVDVLAAQNEDPFTLEPLESLMQLHTEKGKDFILARVATVDPLDETRFYYSYYAAHHINKVLFRTQPEANLLHRMKAKNPLNNMTIIGDVHYYVFTAAQGKEMDINGTSSPSRPSTESSRSATSAGGGGRTSRDLGFVRRHHYMMPSLSSPSTIVENLRQLLMGNHPVGKKRLHLFMSPEAVYVTDSSGKSTGDAGGGGGEFKNTARRLSADDIYVSELAQPPPPTISRNVRNGGRGAGPGILTTNSVRDSNSLELSTVVRPKSAHLYDAAPWSAGPVGSFPGSRPFRHHTVRSMSYMNDHVGATNPYDWVQLHLHNDDEEVEAAAADGRNKEKGNVRSEDTEKGRFGGKKHRRARSGTSRFIEEPATPSPRFPKAVSPKTPAPIFYEFQYYATDDDFLMKSSVRQYFKQHALEPSDSVLFTISSGTTTSLPAGDVEAHPALLGFHYSIEDSEESSRRNRLCSCKYLKYLLLVYVAFGFVLVKYVVAETYAYLAVFLLVFVLCFAMIFCVEIRDIQARNQVSFRTE